MELKIKKEFLNINVGKWTLTDDLPINIKNYIYMNISKGFFESEKKVKVSKKKKIRSIDVKLSDVVSSEEIKVIKDIKNDDLY